MPFRAVGLLIEKALGQAGLSAKTALLKAASGLTVGPMPLNQKRYGQPSTAVMDAFSTCGSAFPFSSLTSCGVFTVTAVFGYRSQRLWT